MNEVLYKYRSLQALEFFLDILLNKRLYASPYNQLNDPMEGVFTYKPHDSLRPFVNYMTQAKQELKICSLSQTSVNTLLWAYYADSNRGVAVGIKRPETSARVIDVKKIEYTNSLDFVPFDDSDPDSAARRVLSKKMTPWQHEEEVRVFSYTDFIPVEIVSVHLGYQVSPEQESLVTSLVEQLCDEVPVRKLSAEELDSNTL